MTAARWEPIGFGVDGHPLYPPTYNGPRLAPLGVRRDGRPIFPIMGGAPDDDGGDGDGGGGGDDGGDGGGSGADGGSGDRGYPARTPVAEMDAEQRAAYWEHHARRHEDKWKKAEPLRGQLREAQESLAAYESLTQTEQERAANEARDAADRAARDRYVPRLVRTEFASAASAAGVGRDRLDALLEDLDLTRYVTDDDEVDVEKIGKKITSMFGTADSGRSPDMGQGRRGKPSRLSDAEKGRSQAVKRFGDRARSAQKN